MCGRYNVIDSREIRTLMAQLGLPGIWSLLIDQLGNHLTSTHLYTFPLDLILPRCGDQRCSESSDEII